MVAQHKRLSSNVPLHHILHIFVQFHLVAVNARASNIRTIFIHHQVGRSHDRLHILHHADTKSGMKTFIPGVQYSPELIDADPTNPHPRR